MDVKDSRHSLDQQECDVHDSEHLWAIVLAGGDGARVRSLFTDANGHPVPKQYCSLNGQDSLVRWAVDRAGRVVFPSHVVVVVAEQHRVWWQDELRDLPPENLIVQPSNKGTAAGLLLPVLEILRRDQRARVIVFPSDHYVSDEGHLSEAVVNAIEALDRNSDRVVLLGMAPHDEDTEYGWIVPSGRPASIQRVAAFVEKPDRFKVRDLRHQGGLLNSLILVGTARTLLNLHSFSVPELVGEFASWWNGPRTGAPVLAGLYRNLPCRDFSKEVLQRCCESLSVVRVPECGWTDLGTPERLREFQALQLSAKRGTAQCSATSNPVNREQRSSP